MRRRESAATFWAGLVVFLILLIGWPACTGASGRDSAPPPAPPAAETPAGMSETRVDAPEENNVDGLLRDLLLYVPEQAFPTGVERIPYAILNHTGDSASVLMAPVLERRSGDDDWIRLPLNIGFCGTPDSIRQGAALQWFEMSWLKEPPGPGHYRLSLQVYLPDAYASPRSAPSPDEPQTVEDLQRQVRAAMEHREQNSTYIRAEFRLDDPAPGGESGIYGAWSILVDWSVFSVSNGLYESIPFTVISDTGAAEAVSGELGLLHLTPTGWEAVPATAPRERVRLEAAPEGAYGYLSLAAFGELEPGFYRITADGVRSGAFYMTE